MLDLHGYKGFAIIKHDYSLEVKAVNLYCYLNDILIVKLNENEICSENHVPVGSVEWCLKCMNKNITPNYYPEWAKEHLHRKVWKSDKWILGNKYFVKPSDKHKRFTGFCTFGTYRKKKKPPYWYSEIVHFVNEWRYYITHGKVLLGRWYYGDEINTPDAPKLKIYIPETFSGTLDFGVDKNNTMMLVEAHEPFACGWYGKLDDDEIDVYLQWLIDGWYYMIKEYYENY